MDTGLHDPDGVGVCISHGFENGCADACQVSEVTRRRHHLHRHPQIPQWQRSGMRQTSTKAKNTLTSTAAHAFNTLQVFPQLPLLIATSLTVWSDPCHPHIFAELCAPVPDLVEEIAVVVVVGACRAPSQHTIHGG